VNRQQSKMTQAIIKQPNHLTHEQVAQLLNTTRDTVRQARYRNGIKCDSYKSPGLSKKTFTSAELKEVYRMIESGAPYKQIGELVGMSIGGVCYHAKKIGHFRCAARNVGPVKSHKRSVHKSYELIRELAFTDMTLAEIAAAADCSISTAFLHKKAALAERQ